MAERPIRILWTSNITLPEVAGELGLPQTPFGGWISQMLGRLAASGKFDLGVAMRSEVPKLRRVQKNGIAYFALPQKTRDPFDVSQSDCEAVLTEFGPDILHVEGAEMRHARRFLATWPGRRLLSMQGVLNGYAPYELGCLPIGAMLDPLRPQLAATALTLLAKRRFRFIPRLKHEREAMLLADHVTGRTLWDRAQAYALNPRARYHHCSRILRPTFHSVRWSPENVEPHSIFVGNAGHPRKGVHIAIEALALLKREFPDVKLIIAGEDPASLSWRRLKRHVGYPVYLRYIIRRLGLGDRIHFTGPLGAEEMAHRMASSHVYLMSSLIENSPNTLGEAMLLGMPCVSAFAGGAPSMAKDEEQALFYRPTDAAMLALQVRRIFSDEALADRLSGAARARAQISHDPDRNLADLLTAYEAILEHAEQVR